MNEEQRERAALYALGLLDADEAAAFEREAAADGELRTLADELRETAASLARMETNAAPPPELKSRVLAHVADENYDYPAAGKVIAGPWARWQPRAAVAILFIFCAGLVWAVIDQQTRYRKAVGIAERAVLQSYSSEQQLREAQADRLQQIAFCALEPVPAPPQTGPQAAVLWDAARRRGQLRVSKLPARRRGQGLPTLDGGERTQGSGERRRRQGRHGRWRGNRVPGTGRWSTAGRGVRAQPGTRGRRAEERRPDSLSR